MLVSIPHTLQNQPMSNMRFGDWLKSIRMSQGLTQSELEAAANLGTAYVSKVERGDIALPGPEARSRIHQAFGTTEDDLVEVGILVRFEPRPGSVIYQPASRASVNAGTAVVIGGKVEATSGEAAITPTDEIPPHMRASFRKSADLSPEKQEQLKALIDTFYEADRDYIEQMRRDRERRKAEGIAE